MTRILIGALSAWKYPERRDRCATTWFRDARALGLDSVFLMGVPDLLRAERHGDLLTLPCPDSYEALPQRTRAFCLWALERNDWDYLFKCDDDTYVSAPRLIRYDLSGRDYVGAEWSPGVAYGSGGAGYFLSRRAARVVADRLDMQTGAEDLLVGQVLREAGVHLSVDPRFIPYGNAEHRPRPDNNLITLHGVNADLFYAAHTDVGGTASSVDVDLRACRSIPPPYEFTGRYDGVWNQPEWSVDRRHIYWLHEVLMSWPFGKALEIGALHGACTTAFVEAINRGHRMHAHICDAQITPSCRVVATNCYFPGRVTCHEQNSVAVLREQGPFDFVFVDGDHRLPCVQEEVEELLKQKTLCVMAHDTSASPAGFEGCEGSAYLKSRLQAESGYFCLEDNAARPSEVTQRGMFFATWSRDLFDLTQRIFRIRCGEA